MSENKGQSQEEKSASVLKEVHQKVADDQKSSLPDDGQPGPEEAKEQVKDTDADSAR